MSPHSAINGLSKSILSSRPFTLCLRNPEQIYLQPGLRLPYLALHTRLFSMYKQATLNRIQTA